ncbi:Ferrichrome-iron receptor [Sphingobium indicum BiD32]|uniref:Ferrichrome-iron receptor n=1 Tax=Sphingobium indicum BiD32 TaxID=1301087 RepID=N1MKQ3_9SPHN|nr:TonB-dependent receptor [Sphingobium indicum]CCW17324.1 Ferrichrome-iron receptor [Sphingobium indicum BiD32]
MKFKKMYGAAAVAILAAGIGAFPAPAQAQTVQAARDIDIPAGSLGNAIAQLGRKTGVMIVFDPALVRGRRSAGLRGTYTPAQALDRLLAGSGFTARPDGRGGFTIARSPISQTRIPVPRAARPLAKPPTEAETDAPEKEDIVVTGFISRDAQAGLFGKQEVIDTPFSITPYTQEWFETRQARTITDVTASDPSVRSNLSASSESEQFVLRGFPLFASEVALEGLYGMLPLRRIPIEPFSKVEIFKGPNALINGVAPFGNIGGMINLVPKRAEARRTLDATIAYLSDGQFGGNIDLGGRFGADRQMGARLNAAHYAGDLALDYANRRADVASLALDYEAGGLKLTADFLYSSETIKGQDHHLTAAGGFQIPDAPDSKVNYGQPWTRTNTESKSFVLGASYEILPQTTISARYGYLEFVEEYRYMQGQIISAAGDFTSRYSLFGSASENNTGEIALRSVFRTGPIRHNFVAAATTLYIKGLGPLPFAAIPTFTNNLYDPVYVPRPAAMFTDAVAAQFHDMRHANDRKLRGIAVADTISAFNDRVLLTLGVRRQNVRMTNFDRVTGNQLNDYDESKTTYAAGLVVKPKENWSIYGSFSQGLTPGLFAPAGSANNGTVFAPFVSTQYELGSKLILGPLTASLALFRINQPFGYVQPTTNLYVLDGDSINKGIEFNVSGKPTEELTLLGGILFSDAKQKGTSGGLTDGKRPIGMPKWQFNLFGEYAPRALPGFAINANYAYTGRQFYDAGNLRPIDSWDRIDLGVRYAFEVGGNRYTARANVENATGNSYWQSASRGFLTRGAPRTVRVSLGMSF